MKKEIIFKREFEEKLNALGIKEQFAIGNINLVVKGMNKEDTWRGFTKASFVWSGTPQGFDYWHNISLQ
jgi:hypothetical protein